MVGFPRSVRYITRLSDYGTRVKVNVMSDGRIYINFRNNAWRSGGHDGFNQTVKGAN